MAYDEELASRVRAVIGGQDGVTEKKMFGGLAFLVHGNMSVGVHGADLVVRTDPASSDAAIREPGVRPFDMTGRPMKGWLVVSSESIHETDALASWCRRGVEYARSMPPK